MRLFSSARQRAFNSELRGKDGAALVQLILNEPQSSFDAINCSSAISLLAKNNAQQSQLTRAAVERVVEISKPLAFAPRELSNYLHGLAKASLLPQAPEFLIQQAAAARHEEFSAFDLAQTLWSAARLNQPGLARAVSHRIAKVKWKKPRDVANAAWALAVLNDVENGDASLRELASVIIARGLDDFNTFDLSILAWSFAKLDAREEFVLLRDMICNRAMECDWSTNSSSSSPQDLANFSWALVRWSSASSLLLVGKLARDAMRGGEKSLLSKCTGKELAAIAWALASLQCEERLVFQEIARLVTAEQKRLGLSAIDVGQLFWAFATVRYRDEHSLDAIAAAALTKMSSSSLAAQQIATIAWACAVLEYRNDLLLHRLSLLAAGANLSHFNAQDLANTVYGFAKLEYYSNALMNAVAMEIANRKTRRAEFSPRSLVNILSSFASVRHYDAKLCQQVGNALLSAVPEHLSLQDLSSLMFSFAILNCKHRELFSLVAKRALELVVSEEEEDNVSLQDLLVLLWSFACCNVLQLDGVKELFQADLPPSRLHVGTGSIQAAMQLHQCRMAWRSAHGGEESALLNALGKGEKDYRSEEPPIQSSKTHVAIMRELRRHFQAKDVVMETFVHGISVDIYLPALQTVVEIDGPHHFFQNERYARTGRTVFKLRLLKGKGLEVLSVPVLHEIASPEHVQTVQKLVETLLQAKAAGGGGGGA